MRIAMADAGIPTEGSQPEKKSEVKEPSERPVRKRFAHARGFVRQRVESIRSSFRRTEKSGSEVNVSAESRELDSLTEELDGLTEETEEGLSPLPAQELHDTAEDESLFERKSRWNIEVTPEIGEAVEEYFEREDEKIAQVDKKLELLEWAERFREEGAVIPAETTDPDESTKREAIITNLKSLGFQEQLLDTLTTESLAYRVDRRFESLRSEATKIYADTVLPITFLSEDDARKAAEVTQRITDFYNQLQRSDPERIEGTFLDHSRQQRRTGMVDISAIATRTEQRLRDVVDPSDTPYSHSTKLLDKIIASGVLRPRGEEDMATTGDHSRGVHFFRDAQQARYNQAGAGLSSYMREQGIDEKDLLSGVVVFPLDTLVDHAPIRVETSNPLYTKTEDDGTTNSIIFPEGAPPAGNIKKEVDGETGATKKFSADSLFFADEDPDKAYQYNYPIEKAYILLPDQASEARAKDLLVAQGYSQEWIDRHVIVESQENPKLAMQEAASRIAEENNHDLFVPLRVSTPPDEHMDVSIGQYSTSSELVKLNTKRIEDL